MKQFLKAFPKEHPTIFGFFLGILFVKLGLATWVLSPLDGTWAGDMLNALDGKIQSYQIEECSRLEKLLPGGRPC